MRFARYAAIAVLILIVGASLFADVIAPASYAEQFREIPNAAPSHSHPLGTDDLGRDRFSRTLHGTRISLLLAPAAALISAILAALIGGLAGYVGGWSEKVARPSTALFLSLPRLFLLLLVGALLPLKASPLTSV